jgi:Tol biopolymer transport system component
LAASRRGVDRTRATVEDGADTCPHVDPDGRRDSVSGLQEALRAAFSYAARGSQKPGEFAMFVI